MSTLPDAWIFTASCPSRLGTVDVVTRFMAESGHYVNEIHSFDDRVSNCLLYTSDAADDLTTV